jgi:hypothetical protein
MLMAAATMGVVLEHSRDRPAASLARTIIAISTVTRIIGRWEQRRRGAPPPSQVK